MKKIIWVWIAALATVLAYLTLTYDSLPDRVASHFDAAGSPNGFQTKDGYLHFVLGFTLLMNSLFGAFYFLMARIPSSLLNIPQKAFWLSSPEHIQGLHQRLKGLVSLLGVFINLVFLFTEQVVYQANVPAASFKVSINTGVFLVILGGLCLAAFSFILFRPPAED